MVDYLGCVGHRVTDQSWGGWSGYTSEGGTSALFKVYAWGTCNHDFVNPSISPCGIAETAGSNTELVGFKYVNPKSSVDGMIGSLVFEYEVVGDSGTIVTPHEIFPNRTKYLNVDITVDLRLLFVYTEIIVVDGEEIEVQQQLVIESTQYVFHLACTVRKNIVEE